MRQQSVDGLRGLACICVVLYHYMVRVSELYPGVAPQAHPLTYYFQFGMELLFLISGYVILMTAENSKSVKYFAVSRFSRLYPTYWACVPLTFFAVLVFGLPGREVGWGAFLANMTMLNGFVGIPNVDGAYWSLKIELMFYAFVGLLIYTGWLRKVNLVLMLWLGVTVLVGSIGALNGLKVIVIAAYAGHFSFGMVLYQINKNGYITKELVGVLIMAVLALYVNKSPEDAVVVSVIFLIFLAALKISWFNRVMSSSVIVYIGSISYAFYLIHQNIGYIGLRYLGQYMPYELSLVIVLCGVILISHLVTKYVESPGRKFLKEKLS